MSTVKVATRPRAPARLAVGVGHEAELPVLVARGGRRRHPGRLGPPGRLGLEQPPPGEVAAVGDVAAGVDLGGDGAGRPTLRDQRRSCGTGGRRRRRRARRGRSPGRASACSSAAVSRSAGWAAPGLPTVAARSSAAGATSASFLASAPHGPGVGAGDHQVVDRLDAEPGQVEGLPRPQAGVDVLELAEALLPGAGGGARRACATDRGTRRRPWCRRGARRSAGASSPRRRPAARRRRRRRRTRRRRRAGRRARRPAATSVVPGALEAEAQRRRPPSGPRRRRPMAPQSSGSRRAAWTTVALVLSRYGGVVGGVDQQVGRGSVGRGRGSQAPGRPRTAMVLASSS